MLCTHPQPGQCLTCTDTAPARAARAALGHTLHAQADSDRYRTIREHLARVQARPAREAALAVPRYLTPGPGGSYLATVAVLVKLDDARVNAILNSSPWSKEERKALAADILIARRQAR